MQRIYSNNGLSFRAAEDGYVPTDGEVAFNDVPSADDLSSAFPAYTASIEKESTIEQIGLLEAQVTERRIREAVLGIDGGWLQTQNSKIAALRAQL